jgi:ATP-binding cassette, subfamily B, bacterial MsbA
MFKNQKNNRSFPKKKISTFFLYVKNLRKWGKAQKNNFFIANFFMVLVAITTAMYPLVIDFAFDTINENNKNNIYIIPFIILTLTITKGIAYFYQTVYVGKVSNGIIKDIQLTLYNKILYFDTLLLNQHKSGSLQSRFINDLNVLKESIIRTLNNLIRDLLTLIGLIGSMIYLDWFLTLCVIFIYPLCIKPIVEIGKATRKISLKLQEKVSSASAFLNESFSAIRVIKTYNLEGLQKEKANKKFQEIYDSNIKIIKTRAKIEPTLEIIGGLAISVVLVLAGFRILNEDSDFGSFTGFISALLIAVQPARALGTLNTILQEGAASLLRLEDVLGKKNLIIEAKKPKIVSTIQGELRFSKVSFYYNKNNYILKNIDCNIKPKETLVIVGANGSGKSTFLNLIPRIFDPNKGKIFIDKINLKNYNTKNLREFIALVSQDVILFDTSIIQNIALANQKATREEIITACKQADAHDFISKLEKSYETIVGDRGLNLSGGERQKISIARAIIKKPKILLLDEATSALDNKSEVKVNKTLTNFSKNMTSIIIAHRLSTILNAKKILFFDQGEIIANGSHKELIKKNILYRNHFLETYKT